MLALFPSCHLGLRIVNQSSKFIALGFCQDITEDLAYPHTDHSGSAADKVLESIEFSVDITQKILCRFRKSQNRSEVDDFGPYCFSVRILLCQKLQILNVRHCSLPSASM